MRWGAALVCTLLCTLWSTTVANAASWTIEAESTTWSPPASAGVGPDVSATGGRYLLHWANNTAWTRGRTPYATRLSVRAKGSQCLGAPHAVVKVDGATVLTAEVSATTWREYAASVSIPAGDHELSVQFANDLFVSGSCDRNLYWDAVSFSGPDFIASNGDDLTLGGEAYKFTGLNEYTMGGHCAYATDLTRDLKDWGPGKRVLRTWFFQSSTGTGARRDWARFDAVLAAGSARDIKVIPVLLNEWADCEAGHGTLTRSFYATTYRTAALPGERTDFRRYVAEVVTRYKDDPAVAFWQIGNELETPADSGLGCAWDGAALLKGFADDIGGLIHSLDPNHLVSLGTIGGGQCGASATDYQLVHSSAGVDLCEYHDYGAPAVGIPGDAWNGLQLRIEQCDALDKPLIVGEAGISLAEAGDDPTARAAYLANKIEAQFARGIDGFLAWQFVDVAHSDAYKIGPGDPALSALTYP